MALVFMACLAPAQTAAADATVHASVGDATAVEGRSGSSTKMTFTITTTAPRSTNTRFYWTSTDYTATDGSDYLRRGGAVSVLAGQTSATFTVVVLGDDEWEYGSELFTVGINPVEADVEVDGAEAFGTIADDDPISQPSVSVGDVTLWEGNGTPQTSLVAVTLSKPVAFPVSVQYRTEDRTAIAPTDYRAASGTLVVRAGRTSATLPMRVNANLTPQADRAFVVRVTAASGGVGISRPEGSVTIRDDDSAPAGVSIGDVALPEGDLGNRTATFTVTLAAPSPAPVVLSYNTTNGSAIENIDYVRRSRTLRIAAGRTTARIAVVVKGEILPESDELFSVVITSTGASGVSIVDGTGSGRIVENDYSVLGPDAPTVPQDVALAIAPDLGEGWVRATWWPPIYNGSSLVSSYYAVYTDGTGTTDLEWHFVDASATLQDSFFCGVPAHTCRVKVVAVNATTAGALSALSNAVTT
ncbi:MAG TPA: Calx-beta domain-containing protein [Acidimicrobiia bacterium]|nr:Calx-beta domain-containing protein [Acidimicrobiia bacterium]